MLRFENEGGGRAAPKPTTGWPNFRCSFVETLALIGSFAFAAAVVIAFIAWLALMPSIGLLWLVGWL